MPTSRPLSSQGTGLGFSEQLEQETPGLGESDSLVVSAKVSEMRFCVAERG